MYPDEDAIPSSTLLAETNLDIIQYELEDTAGDVTQRHHSPTTSGVTSAHRAQDVVPDTPRRYPTHIRQGPDRYSNFMSHLTRDGFSLKGAV